MGENQSAGIESWPVSVQVFDKPERLVRLNELSNRLKQLAWGEIQHSSPALASLLRDEDFRAVAKHFSADIYVDAEHAPCLPPERLRGRSG